jgi:CubicO group peptidase (beta-lactamase class C family)
MAPIILGVAMQRGRLKFVTAALVIIATAGARADRTDDYVKAEIARFHLPGLSLVVVKDGEVIKAAGYGFANVERRIAADPATVYKIGSVSKQFIATGIMLLVQEGRVALDDPISKHVSGTPAAWRPITIRHLLTHTSGLVRESPGFDPFKIQSDAAVIGAVYSVPLRFAPGAKYEYSNTGYYVLAEVIRTVTGEPWNEYLQQKVFSPAGMSTTFPTNTKRSLPNLALGYTGDGHRRTADDWPALRPSGAFLSTVLDLAKWDALLYKDALLSEATRRQMWTPVQLNDGTSAPYGFGWHVDSVRGHRRVRHGGGLPGFSAELVRFVDDRLTIIALTNGDDVDLPSIVNGVAALYLPSGSRGMENENVAPGSS